MKTLAEQLAVYSAYHRDKRNRLTHFIGVPAISFAILIPMAWARVDLGPVEVSLAMAFAAAVLLYYFLLDVAMAGALTLVFLPLLYLAETVARLSPAVGWTVFGVLFAGGWILQLLGHAFEGRRPALVDNVFQIFVAPLFLMAEVFLALGFKRDLFRRIEDTHEREPPASPGGRSLTGGGGG